MERQYIFFKTGRALLVFVTGIVAIVASTEALSYMAPSEGWLVLSAVVILTIVVIVVSFKADARFWRKPRNQ